MANQVTVSNNNTINVTVEPPANVQVQVSRAVIGTVANVQNADLANYVVQPNQSNITSVGTLTGLTSSGNITAPFFIGNVVGNISGNIVVPGSNTAVLYNNQGNAGASDALKFNYSSNVLTANGNIVANYFIGNGSQLTDIVAPTANFANYAGNVTVSAQPNITSVGVLTGLVVGGNITPNSNVTYDLGNNTNRFNDLYLAGNTIYLGAQEISANATGISFTGNLSGDATGLSNITGANVTGYVANATHSNIADVANSVAVANVSGIGNIATVNLDGNVANLLTGTGTWVAIPTVSSNANYANFAGQVINATQSNITTVGTLLNLDVAGNITANKELIGPNTSANFTRFPNTRVVISNVASGIQQNEPGTNGLVSEAAANPADTSNRGVGVYGVGYTSGGASADGIDGEAHVSDTSDTGTATGVRGYSYDTHAGGINIGVYASALNAGINYALYMKHGDIFSSDPQSWTLADNTASALSFNATGKTGILDVVTTNGSEGVKMSGYANITGNLNSGNANLGNLAVANFYSGDGSLLSNINGANISNVTNANYANYAGNVTVSAQPNITSVGTLTSLSVTGNATFANSIILSSTSAINDITGVDNGSNANQRGLRITGGTVDSGNSTSGNSAGTVTVNGGNSYSNTDTGTVWNATGGILQFNSGSAYTANGNATSQQITLSTGSAQTDKTGRAVAGSITISGGGALADSNTANTGDITIRTGAATATTSGTARSGNIDLQIGATNGATGNTIGNINIGTASNVLYGSPTRITIGQANTPTIIGGVANITGNLNVLGNSNLVSLNVVDSSNANSVRTQFIPNSVPIWTGSANSNAAYRVTTQYWPNASLGYPTQSFIRSRGDATTPTTAVNGDRIVQDRYFVYNGNANVSVASTIWSLSSGGTLNSNANQAYAGGQWQTFTGNPASGDLANSSASSPLNVLTFTNSGSLQITPGTAPNSSLGQSTSSLIMTNYGASTANLVQTGGLNFQRARGNRDSVESVQAGDQVGRSVFVAYSNGAYQSSNVAQYRVVVDSTYVANDVVVPMSHEFQAVSNVAGVATFKTTRFYANGVANFPGDIVTTGTANVGALTVTGASNLGDVGNITITGGTANYVLSTDGAGVLTWVAQSSGGGSSISNGNTNIDIPSPDGDVSVAVNSNNVATFTGANTSLTFPIINAKNNLIIGKNMGNASITTDAGLIALGSYGTGAGQQDNQNGIAIGTYAADTSQGYSSIAVGFYAGQTQGNTSIAIGQNAGSSQADETVAIGFHAGETNQGNDAIAIGTYAGSYNQGANSIAIGFNAGASTTDANTIILNATGVGLNSTSADAFFVKPIRNANTSNVLYYDSSSGEITYDVSTGGGGTPGGANTELQFNDNGVFGGISTVTWDGSNISLGAVGNVKVTGGVNNEVIRTDGAGNLSFSSIAQTLLVGTRAGPYTVPITNYTFEVTTRSSGNVTVYVN